MSAPVPVATSEVEVTGPSSLPWTQDLPYRVRAYIPRKGVSHTYFAADLAARAFASSHRLYAKPCVVELSPRLALEAS